MRSMCSCFIQPVVYIYNLEASSNVTSSEMADRNNAAAYAFHQGSSPVLKSVSTHGTKSTLPSSTSACTRASDCRRSVVFTNKQEPINSIRDEFIS